MTVVVFSLLRGGSWGDYPRDCRSAYRNRTLPALAFYSVGFRVVCKLPKTPRMPNYKPLRGGSWFSLPRNCRSAYRDHSQPGYAHYGVGFRVVCKILKTSKMIGYRSMRGGSWYDVPRLCRSACRGRGRDRPDGADTDVGFRVVCKLPLNIENA